MGSWLNKCLWTFLEALYWVSVMYIVAHGMGSLPFHDHRTWQVEAHPRQWEMTTQLCDRVVWRKGPRYGLMGGQNLEGDGHRSLWCPCSGDGGTPLDPSGGSTLALASAVLCGWWAWLLQEQCCVFLLSEYLVLSGCLILQDPLVRGPWEWMTRLMSRMMQLMRSWTASSSQPPKCPVSEWCRGRGSAPGPTGSLVSALELGCGTLPAGTSPPVLYDPGRAGTQGWAPVSCQWCPEGPPVPIGKRVRAGQSALATREEGCCSHLSSVFAISGQASPNSHFVPRKVWKTLRWLWCAGVGTVGPVAKYCPGCFAEAILLPLTQHQGLLSGLETVPPGVHCCSWTCWRWNQG